MGHFLVKLNGRADHKVYVAVFSCFESRAVHAEVVFKLDADSAINAITRFNSRRPGMNHLYSDRGTNFVAANSILTKDLEAINKKAAPSLAKRNITWQFNPPHAPHRGGDMGTRSRSIQEDLVWHFKGRRAALRHLCYSSNRGGRNSQSAPIDSHFYRLKGYGSADTKPPTVPFNHQTTSPTGSQIGKRGRGRGQELVEESASENKLILAQLEKRLSVPATLEIKMEKDSR